VRFVAVVLAEHAEQPPQLLKGRPAGGLDGRKRLAGLLRLGLGDVGADARLHRDHAHAVGDHVVQLAGEPEALIGDRAASQVLAGLFELGRPLFELGGVGAALADEVPEQPGGGQYQSVADPGAQAGPARGELDQGQPDLGGGQTDERDAPFAVRRHGVDRHQDRRPQKDGWQADGGECQPAGHAGRQHRDREPPPCRERQGVQQGQRVPEDDHAARQPAP
jgi:hypothetical protein